MGNRKHDTLKLLGLPSNAGTTWCAFDPYTGEFIYAIYGIPSGSTVFGENGEILIYTVNTARGYMTLWNSTNIPSLYAGTEVGSSNIQQWIPEGKIVNGTGLAGTTYQGQPAVLFDANWISGLHVERKYTYRLNRLSYFSS